MVKRKNEALMQETITKLELFMAENYAVDPIGTAKTLAEWQKEAIEWLREGLIPFECFSPGKRLALKRLGEPAPTKH